MVRCAEGYFPVGDGCVKISPWGKEMGPVKWRIDVTCPEMGNVIVELGIKWEGDEPEVVSFKAILDKKTV